MTSKLSAMRRPLALALLCAIPSSCGLILGITSGTYDGNLHDAGAFDATVADSLAPSEASTSDSLASSFDVSADVGVNCAAEQPVASAIFVSLAGQDSNDCGAQGFPCATLAQGLAIANVNAISNIYVAAGTYLEGTLQLTPGITVQGAWSEIDHVWTRICTSDRISHTVVQTSGANVTLRANFSSAPGVATIDTLTFLSATSTSVPGQSIYGLFASGVGTVVNLLDVQILMAGVAGSGTSGSPGAVGTNGGGTCNPGPGGNGADASVGGMIAAVTASNFSASGFAPALGGSGGAGVAGNGGQVAQTVTLNCVTCVGDASNCVVQAVNTLDSGDGLPGCSGAGGSGGSGGGGGGGAFAIYATSGAVVTVNDGAYQSGTGGNGGAGGGGGLGGLGNGTAPSSPTPLTCTVGCDINCNPILGDAGINAILAGAGGVGAMGGAGAGGPSYTVVQLGDASVTASPQAQIVAGVMGGQGGPPNGPVGGVGATWP